MLNALFLAGLAAVGAGQSEPPRWNLGIDHTEAVLRYSRSLGYPAKIKACALALPDQKAEFSQAFKAWKSSNRDKLEEGRNALLEESSHSVRMVEANQALLADQFKATPAAEQVAGCQGLLAELKAET